MACWNFVPLTVEAETKEAAQVIASELWGALWPKPHIVKDNAGFWTIINYHERIDNPHEPLFDKAWLYVRHMNFPELL